MAEAPPEQLIEIAGAYVGTEIGIPAAEYEFTFEGLQGDLYSVNAVHKDDLAPDVLPGAGSGKSRQILIDPETLTVKSALRSQ